MMTYYEKYLERKKQSKKYYNEVINLKNKNMEHVLNLNEHDYKKNINK